MTEPHAERTDLGAYLLDLLTPDERAAFERHLSGCPDCTAELDELAPTAELLGELAAAGPPLLTPEPGPELLPKLVASVREARRRSRRRRLSLVAVAAALVIAGPVATAALTGSPPAAVAVQQFSATDQATGASATVGLSPRPWGSEVTLAFSLGTLQGPLSCDLVAVSAQGTPQTVTTWSLPATPYSTLHTTGGTALATAAIDHFEIRTLDPGGRLLLTVPVR
ncbi:zf-HC2 domain-containing protein [Kitasatospora sp. NPDC002227]|uniref:anti-sigma factor family protein n=1 Tax=Kitasatospora sp. NPDC002227 TaxID=3154773 RepID=UPI00331B8C26